MIVLLALLGCAIMMAAVLAVAWALYAEYKNRNKQP